MCLRFLVKYILFTVNLIFTIIGLALIGIGVFVLIKLDEFLGEITSAANAATGVELSLGFMKFVPYVIIALGAIIFLIAFCGCCGSVTETKWLLVTYVVFMALLAAIKIYLAVQLLTQSAYMRETAETFLNDMFYSPDPEANATFHALENVLSCCGTTGPDVYDYVYENVSYVPPSCCGNLFITTLNETSICLREDAFQVGCVTRFGDLATGYLDTIGHVLIYIIVAEVVAIIFAVYVAATIKKKKYA